jgi:hypothetical protein
MSRPSAPWPRRRTTHGRQRWPLPCKEVIRTRHQRRHRLVIPPVDVSYSAATAKRQTCRPSSSTCSAITAISCTVATVSSGARETGDDHGAHLRENQRSRRTEAQRRPLGRERVEIPAPADRPMPGAAQAPRSRARRDRRGVLPAAGARGAPDDTLLGMRTHPVSAASAVQPVRGAPRPTMGHLRACEWAARPCATRARRRS